MSKARNILAGLGGAIALNILHESLKHKGEDMPRIDLLGEEALQKGLSFCGHEIQDPTLLYRATLAGDIISNAAYYSMIGARGKKHLWTRAAALGIASGVGAIALPRPMGLNPEPVARNQKVKVLTIGYYLAGALVTAGLLHAFGKTKNS